MEIHTLRMQGLSIRKIAAVCGISRNAVRRALRSSAPPTGRRHRPKGVKLAPFSPTIAAWMADPVKQHWTAERIFDELQERGYAGGRTVLKDYLLAVRPKPRPQAEARFLVRPGQQMQVDWAEMGPAVIDGRSCKLYAFLAVLAWSRQLYVCFTTDMELLTWLDCHRRAFAFFGGVPDEVLIDNLKTGVLSRAGGTVRWHPAYQEFAIAHGFRPIAHFPCRPKTKGRVERIVRFCRERFFLGRDFSDLDGLNAQAQVWLRQRANTRVHRITRERPADRLTVERERLHPLPDYDLVIEESRVADAYALVSVRGCRYSVPAAYARTPLVVQRRPDGLSFLVDRKVVARHPYARLGCRLVQDPAHLPPPPRPVHARFEALRQALVSRLGAVGHAYACAVETKAPHAPLALLREPLQLCEQYPVAVVARAVESTLHFGVVKRGVIAGLCHRWGGTPQLHELSTVGALPEIAVERRSLRTYEGVVA